MMNEYDINTLYQSAFGYRGMPFPYRKLPDKVTESDDFSSMPPSEQAKADDFEAQQVAAQDQYASGLPVRHSYYGVPLYMPTGFNYNGNIIQLPNEPIVTSSLQKNIKETALAGNTRRGTVKEIITVEDVVIKIQGICIDFSKQQYPEEQVQQIYDLFKVNQSIEIINYVLNTIIDVKNVVIKSISIPGSMARPYSQPYTISLVSDEDFLLVAK